MIIAKPGYVLLELDWAAIEAVLVGYSAKSQAYINLAKAGVHGWLTSHFIKRPIDWQLPFDQLQAACKNIKRANPAIYESAKRVVHGSNYLLSSYGIWDEYMELFESERQVEQLQQLYFTLPPGQDVRRWQRAQIDEAHANKKLRNHFDCIHYFYELYRYSKRTSKYELGDDAKRAVAFVPQSDAAFMQREMFLDVEAIDARLCSMLELPTHDSIVAEVLDREADIKDAAGTLASAMTKKWPELGGLSIGVEAKVGYNLNDQVEVKV